MDETSAATHSSLPPETIKFKNGTVYSNSHELNNRLNPNNCGGRAEAKRLKGKCLKLKFFEKLHTIG